MSRSMETIVNRAAEFTGSYGHTRTAPQRVDALSIAQLSATAAMQQLELFANWCYRRADNGYLMHILPSGQIPSGVFAPWGTSGKSGMTRTDRDILRVWLYLVHEAQLQPVWIYAEDQRRWYVDLLHYPTLGTALDWLRQTPIHANDWLTISLYLRNGKTRSVKGYIQLRQQGSRK